MSKLEDILQNEVAAEINAATSEAAAKAQAIVDEALAKAEALKASKQRLLESDHAAALRRAQSAAELLLNQARIAARGKAVDQVKAGAQQALQSLVSADVLKKLADEALGGVSKAESLVVGPSHAAALSEWASSKGLALKTDASLVNGVRVVAEGGKSFVQNVLGERLERAWDALSAKAAKAIWG